MEDEVVDNPTQAAESNVDESGDDGLDFDLSIDDGEEGEDVAGDETPPDEEEVEYEGQKYKVPQVLKDALLRQADYTKKTMEVAEQRRQIEAHAAEIQRQAQVQAQYLQEHAQVVAIGNQIEQYKKLDWAALYNENPGQAALLDRQMRELEAQRQQAIDGINQKQHQQAQESQQATAKQIETAKAECARIIPNWSPETYRAIMEHGVKEGYSAEDMANVINPKALATLNKARLYDEMVAKQTAAAKKPPEPQGKPVAKVAGGKATVKKNWSQMTPKEFAKARRAHLAARNK